jgi:hypothetical protein
MTGFTRRRWRHSLEALWSSSPSDTHVVAPTTVIPDPLFLLAVAKASPSVCGCVAELRAEAARLRRVVDAQLAQGLSVWPHEVEAYDGLERAARLLEGGGAE